MSVVPVEAEEVVAAPRTGMISSCELCDKGAEN